MRIGTKRENRKTDTVIGSLCERENQAQKRESLRDVPEAFAFQTLIKFSRFSMPEQEFLRIEQCPLHVFPGLTLVLRLVDVVEHGLDLRFLRRPGQR